MGQWTLNPGLTNQHLFPFLPVTEHLVQPGLGRCVLRSSIRWEDGSRSQGLKVMTGMTLIFCGESAGDRDLCLLTSALDASYFYSERSCKLPAVLVVFITNPHAPSSLYTWSYLVLTMVLQGGFNLDWTEEETEAQSEGLNLLIPKPLSSTGPLSCHSCAGLRRLSPEAGLLDVWAMAFSSCIGFGTAMVLVEDNQMPRSLATALSQCSGLRVC